MNDVQLHNLIDTAMKIGLGSLITWFATITTLKIKIRNERRKYMLDINLNMYLSSIEKIEVYFEKLSRVLSYVGKIQKSNDPLSNDFFEICENDRICLVERNDKLVESRNYKDSAIIRLKLLGAEKLKTILDKVKILENKLQNKIVFSKSPIPHEYVLQLKELSKSLIEEARSEMAIYYNSLTN